MQIKSSRIAAVETLVHFGKTEMTAGDMFVIETPGGGGYGTPG